MISDLSCLYCQRPAFAVINVELLSGRGRWPTCANLDCINRAHSDAGVRLANAANQYAIHEAQPRLDIREVIDVEVVEPMNERNEITIAIEPQPFEPMLSIKQIRDVESRPVMVCTCGHSQATHFRGRNSCLHSTDTEAWACDCEEFRQPVQRVQRVHDPLDDLLRRAQAAKELATGNYEPQRLADEDYA